MAKGRGIDGDGTESGCVGIPHSFRWRCPRRRGALRRKPGGMIEQIAQREEGVDAHTWLGSIPPLATGEGIEHPRGDAKLCALRECDDDTACGLAPPPSDHLDGLPAEGMVWVTDWGHRRRMSSVTMSVGTALRRICWR
jgi:hypothetical protein